MALEFYVEQADRSPQSGVANESVYAGELVNDDGSGVNVLSFTDGNENVALARYDAEKMAAETDEDVIEEVYDVGQRVQYQPLEDSAILRIRTPEDDTADATAIGHRDVVGIVDESAGDAPANVSGRVVEEGYGNGATTFDRSTGNFKAVGVAYRPSQRGGEVEDRYDHPVRVIAFSELKED
jgi:hypothetical protein